LFEFGSFLPKITKKSWKAVVDFTTLAACCKASTFAKPKPSFKLKNMDFKQIQELIKMVNKSNIGELTVEQKDFRVTIKQKEEHVTQVMSAAPLQAAPMQMAPVAASQPVSTGTPEKSKAAEAPAASNTVTIKSPMIGTFYRKSSPDKPNLVDVGSDVGPGSVVCVIEAMKLFNEIESEVKGKIVKVLVDDASPVEYDQPLFLVEPA
jgi:acetyl-CoA carboxylase biotin carboxyl carrier protein